MKRTVIFILTGLSALYLACPVFAQDNPDEQLFLAQERLAKKGRADAQYYLGEMYEQGLGTAQNLDSAFKWYKSAADHGHRLAKRKMAKHDEIISHHKLAVAEEMDAEQAHQQAKVEINNNDANIVTAEQAAEAAEKKRRALALKKAQRQAAVRAMLKRLEGQPEAFE